MAQSVSNLPIGAKIKFGKHSINGETAQPITWIVVAKNHSGYPANSTTFLTEKIIDLRALDANEPGNPGNANILVRGNNNYNLSNLAQWLNKDTTPWFEKTHPYDTAPDNANIDESAPTGYTSRPGFLSNFSTSEKNAIPTTNIITMTGQTTTETKGFKLFLPSISEVGVTGDGSISTVPDGALWEYFKGSRSKTATLTQQVMTWASYRPSSSTTTYTWRLRSAWGDTGGFSFRVDENGAGAVRAANEGSVGVRPAMNLLSTQYVSDTTDSDGCYTMVWNSAPPIPTTLNVPTTIYGGKQLTISWSGVTDPDGDAVTYQLERSLDGGEYSEVYSGPNLSYVTTIVAGVKNVQFRLKATDSFGASSGYISSTSRTVINNVAPTISGSDSNLGTKSAEFSQTYTVNDSDGNTVTVTEKIDGVTIRSYVATLNATNTFSVTGTTWLSLSNGSHTMTITATDGSDTTVRTYTFTKSVSSFAVRNITPLAASTKPIRIKIVVDREIPVGATFKVEVCRNAFDSNLVWEDATSSVTGNQAHVFQTEIASPSAGKWGIYIRVTVNRNGKAGECWVKSIGGNFE